MKIPLKSFKIIKIRKNDFKFRQIPLRFLKFP